jgi:hypothetical protein
VGSYICCTYALYASHEHGGADKGVQMVNSKERYQIKDKYRKRWIIQTYKVRDNW